MEMVRFANSETKIPDDADEIFEHVEMLKTAGRCGEYLTEEELRRKYPNVEAITHLFMKTSSDKARLISNEIPKNTHAWPKERIRLEDARTHMEILMLLLLPRNRDIWLSIFYRPKMLRESIAAYLKRIHSKDTNVGCEEEWRGLGPAFQGYDTEFDLYGITGYSVDLIEFYFE